MNPSNEDPAGPSISYRDQSTQVSLAFAAQGLASPVHLLIHENKRLREKNAELKMELGTMASLYGSSGRIDLSSSSSEVSADAPKQRRRRRCQVEKQEPVEEDEFSCTRVGNRIVLEVNNYHTGEITLEEARAAIFSIVGTEKDSQPSIASLFTSFMQVAVVQSTRDMQVLPTYCNMLAYCLIEFAEENEDVKEEILDGIAAYCHDVFYLELWTDAPEIWGIVAEMLVKALAAADGLFKGTPPTLKDFEMSFLNAAKDTREPYALFVTVLKRLAEIRGENFWHVTVRALIDLKFIFEFMDEEKLNEALTAANMEFERKM